uniref:Uncharacterized protein n=1 Tax=Caenorhabditis tropicalis TaxID=1561998 RepID=A0A1I7UYL1_9PELO
MERVAVSSRRLETFGKRERERDGRRFRHTAASEDNNACVVVVFRNEKEKYCIDERGNRHQNIEEQN